MHEPPHFLTSPLPLEGEETFKPEMIPFRGGFIAWGAAVIVGITMIFIRVRTGGYQCMTISFFLFLLLAAILITFNHWIDSNTNIMATESHLSYRSPIKKSSHRWDQITKIKVMRAGQSWRVSIIGTQSSFSLRIKSELTPDDHRGRILELPKGDELIRIICSMADLSTCEYSENTWVCQSPS